MADDPLGPGIPVFSMEELGDAIYRLGNGGLDPSRPYDGQPWTSHGERGRTVVEGLTYRDVHDCMVLGFLYACKGFGGLAESGTATENDVFEAIAADPDFDPIAVIQNGLCEMERRAGIFPNLPPDSEPGSAEETDDG